MKEYSSEAQFLHVLADAARQETMKRFRGGQDIHIDTKPKQGFSFDPVTDADREAERVIRSLIEARYPDHKISGEEFGTTGESEYHWIIDPVDGTRPFICGLPVWGTLIGLYKNERALLGMMCQPFTGERFWCDGVSSRYSGPHGESVLQTRKGVSLDQAILHTTSPESVLLEKKANFNALNDSVKMTRYGGECYAMAMLAAGHIDLCIEFSLQPYDIAALIPIIESAGGVVTTLEGGRPENGGAILASGCSVLHEEALRCLSS